ncbi:MAG TPA: type I-A CRISPR-associated protein Cas4/Csa1 [Firmicutes bacterium]|nr:type I-A CRISPR-associated protein Cas4/Csa1 [Bacillota bacterium]
MYFLSDEERKILVKGLIPKARAAEVNEELRGWNWHRPPLEPIYAVRLGVYEVASCYCPTARDLFLRRVRNIKARPNEAMMMGSLIHEVVSKVLVKAKRLIYQHGVQNYRQIVSELLQPDGNDYIPALVQQMPEGSSELARQRAESVWQFESSRIIARLQDVLSRQPYVGEDALVALAVPVVVEQKLDGTFLGLSRNLSADACTFTEPMVLDLKYGKPRDFHRLGTTGYAMVMEAIYEFPVDIGCIVYVDFQGDRVVIKREFHLIDDELRQWFIEERDQKMRIVSDELDPGKSEECYDQCPYAPECSV